ncbi:trehalose permease IIC protein, partial [Staphylococcus haemolyticus]
LPLKLTFFAAICTSIFLGAIIGANKVLGSVGVGGGPAFISIHSEFWFIYIPVTLLAMVIPAILTIIFARFTTIKAKKMVATPEET